eukprot:CAMPEP_0178466278 /NCGR_PEP_ID=MMETSP0689_2-20121128/51822_1 /TAXON_ID=160604 /ORGANISM="Amphidinium massartii, Strain CS-259" /LENGTH=73 /DNA_ID=CAMNT_0020093299 /DNA_START=13 /DNA_END=231 /DNA_ORIENTATION=-
MEADSVEMRQVPKMSPSKRQSTLKAFSTEVTLLMSVAPSVMCATVQWNAVMYWKTPLVSRYSTDLPSLVVTSK